MPDVKPSTSPPGDSDKQPLSLEQQRKAHRLPDTRPQAPSAGSSSDLTQRERQSGADSGNSGLSEPGGDHFAQLSAVAKAEVHAELANQRLDRVKAVLDQNNRKFQAHHEVLRRWIDQYAQREETGEPLNFGKIIGENTREKYARPIWERLIAHYASKESPEETRRRTEEMNNFFTERRSAAFEKLKVQIEAGDMSKQEATPICEECIDTHTMPGSEEEARLKYDINEIFTRRMLIGVAELKVQIEKENMSKQKAAPICEECIDTHTMPESEEEARLRYDINEIFTRRMLTGVDKLKAQIEGGRISEEKAGPMWEDLIAQNAIKGSLEEASFREEKARYFKDRSFNKMLSERLLSFGVELEDVQKLLSGQTISDAVILQSELRGRTGSQSKGQESKGQERENSLSRDLKAILKSHGQTTQFTEDALLLEGDRPIVDIMRRSNTAIKAIGKVIEDNFCNIFTEDELNEVRSRFNGMLKTINENDQACMRAMDTHLGAKGEEGARLKPDHQEAQIKYAEKALMGIHRDLAQNLTRCRLAIGKLKDQVIRKLRILAPNESLDNPPEISSRNITDGVKEFVYRHIKQIMSNTRIDVNIIDGVIASGNEKALKPLMAVISDEGIEMRLRERALVGLEKIFTKTVQEESVVKETGKEEIDTMRRKLARETVERICTETDKELIAMVHDSDNTAEWRQKIVASFGAPGDKIAQGHLGGIVSSMVIPNIIIESALARLEIIGAETIQDKLMSEVKGAWNTNDRRKKIIPLIGVPGDEIAQRCLVAMVSDPVLGESAFERLKIIGTETVQDELLAEASKEENPDSLRIKIIESFGASGNKAAIEPAIAMLSNRDSRLRRRSAIVIEALVDETVSSEVVEKLTVELLKEGSKSVYRPLLAAIGASGKEIAIKGLIKDLINAIHIRESIEPDEDYFYDKTPHTMEAIGKIGGERATKAMLAVLRNEAVDEKDSPEDWTDQDRGLAAGALAASDRHADMKDSVIANLVATARREKINEQGIPTVDTSISDDLSTSAFEALVALGRHADMKDLVIANLVATARREKINEQGIPTVDTNISADTSIKALKSLGELGSKKAARRIAEIVDDVLIDDNICISAAKTLGVLRSKDVAPIIVEHLPVYSKELKIAVIETLDQLNNRTGAVKLDNRTVTIKEYLAILFADKSIEVDVRSEIAKLDYKWSTS